MELTLDEQGAHTLFGNHDENLRLLEDAFDVKISSRGNEITVKGPAENVDTVEKLLGEMQQKELKVRMQKGADFLRQGYGPFMQGREQVVTEALERLRDQVREAQQQVAGQIDQAVAFADASPYPALDEITSDVYVSYR